MLKSNRRSFRATTAKVFVQAKKDSVAYALCAYYVQAIMERLKDIKSSAAVKNQAAAHLSLSKAITCKLPNVIFKQTADDTSSDRQAWVTHDILITN